MRRSHLSLVEILVVIAILAILLSILSPSIQHAIVSAHKVACAARFREIHTIAETYHGDYGYYPECDFYGPTSEKFGEGEFINKISAYYDEDRRQKLYWYYSAKSNPFLCPGQEYVPPEDPDNMQMGLINRLNAIAEKAYTHKAYNPVSVVHKDHYYAGNYAISKFFGNGHIGSQHWFPKRQIFSKADKLMMIGEIKGRYQSNFWINKFGKFIAPIFPHHDQMHIVFADGHLEGIPFPAENTGIKLTADASPKP